MLRSIIVPGCSVHHNILPCRGWDLAEEEVDLSRRSLFIVVGFVAVAVVAVVAVAVTAVLWGGAWFAYVVVVLCELWGGWGWGGVGVGGEGG
jgi:hypothetical protein